MLRGAFQSLQHVHRKARLCRAFPSYGPPREKLGETCLLSFCEPQRLIHTVLTQQSGLITIQKPERERDSIPGHFGQFFGATESPGCMRMQVCADSVGPGQIEEQSLITDQDHECEQYASAQGWHGKSKSAHGSVGGKAA